MRSLVRSLMFAAMVTATLAGPSQAGTWVGGGGEFNMDNQNPWFVQNTTTIKACVLIDPEHFHLPPYPNMDPSIYLRDVTQVAFKYWQDELAIGTRWVRQDKDAPTVGTQNLEFGPCADDTDLRLQFGTLSPAQQAAFRDQGQDPRKFVSLAVRTDYDRVHLKGKGFIYVTADSGPLQPTDVTMMPQPWVHGEARLIKVLAHELGHVFGLQHTKRLVRPNEDLMSSGFPAVMVKSVDPGADEAINRTGIPQFFSVRHRGGALTCLDATDPHWAAVIRFLELSKPPTCLTLTRNDGKIEIYATNMAGKGEPLGSVNLDLSQMLPTNLSPAISMWLPPEQTVFTSLVTDPQQVIAVRASFMQTAEYRDARTGMTRRMLVTIAPDLVNSTLYGLTDAGQMLDLTNMWDGVDADGKSGPVLKIAP